MVLNLKCDMGVNEKRGPKYNAEIVGSLLQGPQNKAPRIVGNSHIEVWG